ncbi:MAG TPA: serine hydrolase [Hyphomonadaceae bacterium]|nr:serine hydrolase [Hyphomonadaceae bacterium]
MKAANLDVPRTDAQLESSLRDVVLRLGFERALSEHRLALALVDVTDQTRPRYAGLNDSDMLYAASLPKIAILLAGFEAIRQGMLSYTPQVKEMFARLVRYSSNTDASRAVQAVGFEFIAKTLTSTKYRLYDPLVNGGLWIGKAYGGPNDYWKRDPLHNISHGATAMQVARFFLMLDRGELVDAKSSAEMKELMSNPGIHHKFVKGLERLPGYREVYRKSGTWKDAHCDAALVEADGKRYIAVALMKDANGGDALPKLIVEMDRLIPRRGFSQLHAPALR